MRATRLQSLLTLTCVLLACGKAKTPSVVPPAVLLKLSGKVVLTGETQLPELAVTMAGPLSGAAATKSDGTYSFGSLIEGRYAVSVSVPSTREQTQTTLVTLRSATDGVATDLVFTPVGRISGTVTKNTDASDAGILVWVEGTGLSAFTDASGKYTLDAVPAGSWTLRAAADGFASSTTAAPKVTWKQTANAPAMELVAKPDATATNHLRGRVSLVGNADPSGVTVTLEGTELGATTNAQGEFDIEGVATGVYAVVFSKGDYFERVPSVLSMPNVDGFIIDGALHPVTSIEVPRAARAVTAPGLNLLRSPDQKCAAVVSTPSNLPGPLHLTRYDGTSFHLGDAVEPWSVLFTPNSAYVLFIDGSSGGIGTLRAANTASGVVSDLGARVAASTYAVTPDSSKVVFVSGYNTSNSTGTLQVATLGAGTATTLASNVAAQLPKLSPDSTQVLYTVPLTSNDAELYVRDLAAAAPAVLLDSSSDRIYGNATFSLDGTLVAALTSAMALNLYPVAGGTPTPIATNAQPYLFRFDGDRLFYVSGYSGSRTLHSVKLDGSDDVELGAGARIDDYIVTSDHTHVVFVLADNTSMPMGLLRSAAIDGSSHEDLADDVSWGGVWVTPDNTTILYSDAMPSNTGSVYAQPIDGGTPLLLAELSYGVQQIASDSKSVLLYDDIQDFTGTGALKLVDLATGNATKLAEGVAAWTAVATPDFSRITYLSGPMVQGAGTLVVHRLGASPEIIPSLSTTIALGWGHDNKVFAVSSGRAEPFTWQNGLYLVDAP